MKSPQSGVRNRKDITPSVEHTAAALSNRGIEVTATTALILFIEEVCGECIHYLADKVTAIAKVVLLRCLYNTRASRSGQQVVLERKPRQQLVAIFGHQNLLLKLNPFVAALRTHEALDADGHAFLEYAVVAPFRVIHRIGDRRPFVAHTDAMGER